MLAVGCDTPLYGRLRVNYPLSDHVTHSLHEICGQMIDRRHYWFEVARGDGSSRGKGLYERH